MKPLRPSDRLRARGNAPLLEGVVPVLDSDLATEDGMVVIRDVTRCIDAVCMRVVHDRIDELRQSIDGALAPPELQMTEIPLMRCYFVTPEYNRSIPDAPKNAIDWASRPYRQNACARKPSAVIGTSPGKIGTAVAQQHLRSILAFAIRR